jgi:bifunctional DNA-binding transcriptional regulator/antitoxin component of YhaV-PrlF toxin-antitoxin module
VRNQLGILEGDFMEIHVRDNEVVIKKAVINCLFCKSLDSLATIGNFSVCGSCVERLNEIRKEK